MPKTGLNTLMNSPTNMCMEEGISSDTLRATDNGVVELVTNRMHDSHMDSQLIKTTTVI